MTGASEMHNARGIALKAAVDIGESVDIIIEALESGRMAIVTPGLRDWMCILDMALEEMGRGEKP